MTITAAYPFGEGIQVNRQVGPGKITSDIVFPGDPGWLEAVAAAGGIEALPSAPMPPTLEQALSDGWAQRHPSRRGTIPWRMALRPCTLLGLGSGTGRITTKSPYFPCSARPQSRRKRSRFVWSR